MIARGVSRPHRTCHDDLGDLPIYRNTVQGASSHLQRLGTGADSVVSGSLDLFLHFLFPRTSASRSGDLLNPLGMQLRSYRSSREFPDFQVAAVI